MPSPPPQGDIIFREKSKINLLYNHSYSLVLMFVHCLNFADSRGRYFIGNMLKYCRYGVKHSEINQSIDQSIYMYNIMISIVIRLSCATVDFHFFHPGLGVMHIWALLTKSKWSISVTQARDEASVVKFLLLLNSQSTFYQVVAYLDSIASHFPLTNE